MNVTIINGTNSDYSNIIDKIVKKIESTNNEVTHLKISDMNIAYCTGCWSCWKRTPGECIHKDDTVKMLTSVINSDMTVYISESSLGSMTSYMKKALDKHVALIHPYIRIKDGECRHYKRYDKFPLMGNIFIDENINQADYDLFSKHLTRAAMNADSKLVVTEMITGREECIDEFNIIKWFA